MNNKWINRTLMCKSYSTFEEVSANDRVTSVQKFLFDIMLLLQKLTIDMCIYIYTYESISRMWCRCILVGVCNFHSIRVSPGQHRLW